VEKNQSLQHINESEMNVAMSFMPSAGGLPWKDKTNPQIQSENSNITQPCVLKTVGFKIERNYFVCC
jgi:hypothetical protein